MLDDAIRKLQQECPVCGNPPNEIRQVDQSNYLLIGCNHEFEVSEYDGNTGLLGLLIGIIFLLTLAIFYDELVLTARYILGIAGPNFGPSPLLVGTFLIIGLQIMLHEYIHKLTLLRLGYSPVKIYWWPPNVKAPNQFVKAEHNLYNLVTPFSSINIVAGSLGFAALHPLITFVGVWVFLANAVGSVGDIRGAIDTWNNPEGSHVFSTDSPEGISIVIKPVTK